MIFQPPFPPTEIEAVAITNIGLMFAHIFILVFLLILLIYLQKSKDYVPVLTVYSFSLLIGMESFTHLHTHFSPMLEVFFLVFQSIIFVNYAIKLYNIKKR